jgi:translation initiation factor IF-3
VNEEIHASEIRVVDEEGNQLGIMSPAAALKIAQEKGLDLVEVAPSAKPPVCRMMDFGRYMFEQSKKEKEARKKQKVIDVKEVKLRLGIEEHDLDIKAKNARRFLEDGDKVKVTVMFRGRETMHSEKGKALLDKLINKLEDVAVVEKNGQLEGRNMIMILSPRPKEVKK